MTTEPSKTYRERREAKAERLREWADKRDAKGTAKLDSARELSDMIPFGQPILVGHHSEGRARRDAERIHSNTSKGYEDMAKAANFRSRADNIEAAADHAIYSDDPDAVPALEARIADLEAKRDRIKAYNASCRKGARDLDLLDEAQRAHLLRIAEVASFQIGTKGEFPRYALTNLSGNINRNRKRLDALRVA